jgi:hypothetical protein
MGIKRKRTEAECIVCKSIIKFPEYVDEDYDGDLLCDNCGLLLSIKLEKGKVKVFKVKEKIEGWKGYKKYLEFRRKFRDIKRNDKGGD